jgi:CRP-like cAMP-binding protein
MSQTNVIAVTPYVADALGGRNHLLAGLGPNDFELLAPHFDEAFLERGRVLQDAGSRIERVYFPHGGLISLVGNAREQHPIDTALVGCEGAVGSMAGLGSQIALSAAVVHLPGPATVIASARLAAAATISASLRHMIVNYNDVLLRQVQQVVVCNTTHRLEERLCRWLVQASDRIGDTLALTQEHLAGILGVQRTTVTMICRKLQADGILNVRRGRILIRDAAALQKKACDCVRVGRQLLEQRPCVVSH